MTRLLVLLLAAIPISAGHLVNIRQLTHGGQNAEAYWSPDGNRLIFQSTRPPYSCDQIFVMNADGSEVQLVANTEGRATAPKWTRDGKSLYFPLCRKVDYGTDCQIFVAPTSPQR